MKKTDTAVTAGIKITTENKGMTMIQIVATLPRQSGRDHFETYSIVKWPVLDLHTASLSDDPLSKAQTLRIHLVLLGGTLASRRTIRCVNSRSFFFACSSQPSYSRRLLRYLSKVSNPISLTRKLYKTTGSAVQFILGFSNRRTIPRKYHISQRYWKLMVYSRGLVERCVFVCA